MKRIAIATILAAAVSATAASAAISPSLRASVQRDIATYDLRVNVSDLSDNQIAGLFLILNSSDSQGEKLQAAKSLLR